MKKKSTPNYSNRSRSTATYHDKQSNHKFFMIPLIIIAGIIPMIVHYYGYNTGLSDFKWSAPDDSYFDLFLYYKQLYLLITCSLMLILLGYRIYRKKQTIKLSPILIPLGIYGLLALLSTLFSEYSSFGFKGMYEQFESLFVLLGYCLIVYYAFLFIESEEDVQYIFRYFVIGVLILGLIGITQALGYDIITSDFGLKNILPREFWNSLDEFSLTFGEKYVYLTLYNPNYVGVYAALVAPILICLTLTSKKLKTILLYLAALGTMIISLLGSKSAAGFIGLAVTLIFILVLLRRYIFRKSWITIAMVGIGVCAVILLVSMKFDTILNRVHTLTNPTKVEKALTDIRTEEDIIITYKGNELRIGSATDATNTLTHYIKDGNNQEVGYTVNGDSGAYEILDERFTGFKVTPTVYSEILCVNVTIDGKDWIFSNQLGDGTYYYFNRFGRADKIIAADSAVFTGYETVATGRGYLWSRTIPLLKDYVFLGSGADTFATVYPQQDYVNLYNYGFADQTLTKPHSMYLQIGVQTGVLSLIAFLVFYGMYFCSSIYLYIKGHFDHYYEQAGVAIFIGTIGYMVTGISNDSTITVAPVFYVLIGVGIAVNYKITKIRKENKIVTK